jgi:hypothetical protein
MDEALVNGWVNEKEMTRRKIIQTSKVIERENWGKLIMNININNMKEEWDYTTIAVHHTAGESINNAAYLLQIEKEHLSKWSDIGYHYIITKDGTIHEGRRIYYRGAHMGGNPNQNPLKIGVSLVGNFMTLDPTQAQINSLISHVQTLKNYFKDITTLGGHRDWRATDCPGDKMYALLDSIREKTGLSSPQ